MASSLSRRLYGGICTRFKAKGNTYFVSFCTKSPSAETEADSDSDSDFETAHISSSKQQQFKGNTERILENGLDFGIYKAILIGQLGQAPIPKKLRSGRIVTLLSIGTGGIRNNRRPLDNEEPKDYANRCAVQWHRVSIYPERLGELAVKNFVPGSILYVEGNLETKIFSDPISGLLRRIREIAVRRNGRVLYLGNGNDAEKLSKVDFGGTTGRSALQTIKQREESNKNKTNNQDGCDDNFSIFSSRSLLSEKDGEELMALRDQLEDLKRQLAEKDELLKSAELLQREMTSMHLKFADLKNEVTEKDSLIKSSQLQLSDAKIKLADKQAAVEKLQWEAMTSNKKVEKLQGDLTNVEGEMSCFMSLIEGLARTDLTIFDGDSEFFSCPLEENFNFESEPLTEIEMQDLEAAREAYIAAVSEAKEKQDDESIAAAAKARFHLQSVVLK